MGSTQVLTRRTIRSCQHEPPCPAATAVDFAAARTVVSFFAEQGWALLCNGVVLFDDGGALQPADPGDAPAAPPVTIGASAGEGSHA